MVPTLSKTLVILAWCDVHRLTRVLGKISPDAYSQLCLQLAFYRIHGYFSAVYETASTRAFLHGRTETCRSLTSDSAKFIQAFQNPKLSV